MIQVFSKTAWLNFMYHMIHVSLTKSTQNVSFRKIISTSKPHKIWVCTACPDPTVQKLIIISQNKYEGIKAATS